jgi:hypothetical protein
VHFDAKQLRKGRPVYTKEDLYEVIAFFSGIGLADDRDAGGKAESPGNQIQRHGAHTQGQQTGRAQIHQITVRNVSGTGTVFAQPEKPDQ